jgi:hypothetical protein
MKIRATSDGIVLDQKLSVSNRVDIVGYGASTFVINPMTMPDKQSGFHPFELRTYFKTYVRLDIQKRCHR